MLKTEKSLVLNQAKTWINSKLSGQCAGNLVREYSIDVQTVVDINWNKRKREEFARDW